MLHQRTLEWLFHSNAGHGQLTTQQGTNFPPKYMAREIGWNISANFSKNRRNSPDVCQGRDLEGTFHCWESPPPKNSSLGHLLFRFNGSVESQGICRRQLYNERWDIHTGTFRVVLKHVQKLYPWSLRISQKYPTRLKIIQQQMVFHSNEWELEMKNARDFLYLALIRVDT